MDVFDQAQILRIFILVFAVLVVVALIVIVSFMIKKSHSKKKELDYFKSQLHKIIRNEALDKALNNFSNSGSREYWLLKAIEINRFGEKEHFFNIKDTITIGRDFNLNNLFVLDENADLSQCKIELHKEIPFITSVSDTPQTVFSFGKINNRRLEKKHTMRNGEAVRLYSGDSVEFGDTKIVFYLYNSNYGLV